MRRTLPRSVLRTPLALTLEATIPQKRYPWPSTSPSHSARTLTGAGFLPVRPAITRREP